MLDRDKRTVSIEPQPPSTSASVAGVEPTHRSAHSRSAPSDQVPAQEPATKELSIGIQRRIPKKPSYTIIDEIKQTIPAGLELHRAYRYQLPILARKFELVVLKLYVPAQLEPALATWRRALEELHPMTTVLINRVEVDQNLQNHLRSRFRQTELLTESARPVLEEILSKLFGTQPEAPVSTRLDPPLRENLRDVPFIAIDRPDTIDREDLIHGEKKSDGSFILRVAFIDITDHIRPHSAADRYALRVGSTLYGRNRAISPVGSQLFGGAGTFKLGELRPAWVVESRISPDKDAQTVSCKIRRAWVKNHSNLDPNEPFDMRSQPDIARTISALAEITRILEHSRTSRSPMIRVEGAGTASRIVAETMIEAKRRLAHYFDRHLKTSAVYRVHKKPSASDIESWCTALHQLKIPAKGADFDSPLSVAGILRSLEEHSSHSARSLSNSILDTLLLRSTYSVKNDGHWGLRLDAYLEIKPRDAAGLANQLQLDATMRRMDNLSQDEMGRRATILNDKRWARDERNYKLRFLEMLSEKLALVGDLFLGEVARTGEDLSYCHVQGFSKWGIIIQPIKQQLIVGDLVALKLLGFNLKSMRFEFQVVQL
jgi:RNB domain